MISVGIDKMAFSIPPYYLDLVDLAQARGVPKEKYLIGIGQNKMAVPSRELDVVALAANAAKDIINQEDKEQIDLILFATESSFDFSKAGAVYLQALLGIQPYARALELKQACYSGTAALLMACDYLRLRPDRKALVVMSDISRYGLNTSGEVTQGAGAVAMILSANPQMLALDLDSLALTDNQYDFWRPAYFSEALVDGAFSNQLYISMFTQLMETFDDRYPERYQSVDIVHFHLPYTKMGIKALQAYGDKVTKDAKKAALVKAWQDSYPTTTKLGREIGNIYTGSAYLSLLSTFMYKEDLQAGQRLGLYSYGSGAVAEFMTGVVQADYRQGVDTARMEAQLVDRQAISVTQYEEFFNQYMIGQELGENYQLSSSHPGYYLKEIYQHRRSYGFRHQ